MHFVFAAHEFRRGRRFRSEAVTRKCEFARNVHLAKSILRIVTNSGKKNEIVLFDECLAKLCGATRSSRFDRLHNGQLQLRKPKT
jgi:hypothetical protein